MEKGTWSIWENEIFTLLFKAFNSVGKRLICRYYFEKNKDKQCEGREKIAHPESFLKLRKKKWNSFTGKSLPRFISPLSPSSSLRKIKTGRIPKYLFFKNTNSRRGETVWMWRRVKITRGENRPLYNTWCRFSFYFDVIKQTTKSMEIDDSIN